MITLTLVMIVKNESKIIERCLDSVCKYIDYVVISDTGSDDKTPEIISEYLQKKSIKGKVYHDEWKNFGYNRTKSIENGKEWLINEMKLKPYEMYQNYFLTIDADMLFVYHDEFKKEDLLTSDVWNVAQQNEVIRYYNTRLMRSNLMYKCVGVTHEYWSCETPNHVTSNLNTVHIDDRGDGGSKSDKFTRDIRLLTEGIKEEPNNVRYYFYLAQSYADSDDIDNALLWYQKRIDMGGWNEEIYISHRQRGELFKKKGDMANAIYEWTKGFQTLPCRSETLYRIINYYRHTREYHLAILYLRAALKIPYPKDCVLFIEHPVYDYKAIEELSIVAYYADLKHEGNLACEYLKFLDRNIINSQTRDNVVMNSFFYIQPILSTSHHTLTIPTQSPYISSGASFLYVDDKYDKIHGIVRAVNYSITHEFKYIIRDPNHIVRTQNYWVQYDTKTNQIIDSYEIENRSTQPSVRNAHIKGFEDIRLCMHNDKLYGLAVDWEYGVNNHPSVVLLFFEKDKNDKWFIDYIRHISYQNEKCQKNWTLLSSASKLFAVYSHHPFTLLELNTDKEMNDKNEYNVYKSKYNQNGFSLEDLRGSASPIYIESRKEWLFLVHEVIFKDTRKYYHRFVRYDQDWNLIGLSEPFYFKTFYIEFALSILYNKENETILIPYSSRDNTTEIITIPYQTIQWLPKTMNEFANLLKNIL